MSFDVYSLETPYILIDEDVLINNLKILNMVKEKSGSKVLLAQKAFSMFSLYPLIRKFLDGTTASGLFEATLGYEKMGGETHVFSTAYKENELKELLEFCDYVIFNSFEQWDKYRGLAVKTNKKFGIRINPEVSTQGHAIYDPSAFGSRLGVPIKNFRPNLLGGISGLHFHTLCEQNSDALALTVEGVEKKFGDYLYQMEWINLGGGHHITRPDYDIEKLISIILHLKNRYKLKVYIEPGEAVVLNTGFLVSTVMDFVDNGVINTILDTSAACHMPDVLEMPYRPHVIGSGLPNEKRYTYRFGGPTCLAGDIIGEYSFDLPLKIGDRVVFTDMAHYTMVKSNMFNGINLPSIAVRKSNGKINKIKSFGYIDYISRLS